MDAGFLKQFKGSQQPQHFQHRGKGDILLAFDDRPKQRQRNHLLMKYRHATLFFLRLESPNT